MANETTVVLVLTNDDGVDAPGIAALHDAAKNKGRRHVVAPAGPYSGCGHRVTTHEPIFIQNRGEDVHVIEGTPADCVRLAVHHLEPNPGWILSGINAGGNLGVDVYHSGTVAAVREGAIHGLPGIAISHYIARGRAIDWTRARNWAARILDQLMKEPIVPGTFWNVNFPHLLPEAPEPEIIFCELDPSPLPLGFRLEGNGATYCGDYHSRARRASGDVAICLGGQIAVSLLRI